MFDLFVSLMVLHQSPAPRAVGSYSLITNAPAVPEEDEDGWNCFVDGNLDCGTAVQKAHGFSRSGWQSSCVYFKSDYVMCADGSVYVKGL